MAESLVLDRKAPSIFPDIDPMAVGLARVVLRADQRHGEGLGQTQFGVGLQVLFEGDLLAQVPTSGQVNPGHFNQRGVAERMVGRQVVEVARVSASPSGSSSP